eukprot:s505_g14.t1
MVLQVGQIIEYFEAVASAHKQGQESLVIRRRPQAELVKDGEEGEEEPEAAEQARPSDRTTLLRVFAFAILGADGWCFHQAWGVHLASLEAEEGQPASSTGMWAPRCLCLGLKMSSNGMQPARHWLRLLVNMARHTAKQILLENTVMAQR